MDIGTFKQRIGEFSRQAPGVTVLESSGRAVLRSECNPHVHSGWELKELASGAVHLVFPGVPHEATGIGPWSVEAAADSFTLNLKGRFLFLNRKTGTANNLLPELFALFARTPETETRLREQLLRTVFEAILSLVAEQERHPEAPEDLYVTAVACLERNYYRREFSVEELAAVTGVTSQYLNRLFRRHGDAGVRRKLIAIRLEKARELLESGSYLVSDAARLTGWSCPFYFCNSFKRRYGVPPVSVRK
ncbi:hypothetical protein SDC9_148244 [bioreactor metagenome]|uniref:HTH araC/xylS-type domain-containing protein n=1 Tax=bioreactor metagenome TaxID=1076179 RepID=A0A645EJZ7_9ZZZZ